jgi:hypothetical protein
MSGVGMQNSMQIVLNLSLISTAWGSCVLDTTLFPSYYYIDQVNAYQLKYDCTGSTSVVNEIANYNTFNYAVKKSISLSGIYSLSSWQNVALRATYFIELKDGFYVPADAELYLDNNPCENMNVIIKGESE